ncbi:MAG: preprotein translocase subunit SecE [Candidatus Omnitrophota bacterium]
MIKRVKRFPKFLKEVNEELKKVNWSTRKELVGATAIVIVVSGLLTFYLWFIDLSLAQAIQFLLK